MPHFFRGWVVSILLLATAGGCEEDPPPPLLSTATNHFEFIACEQWDYVGALMDWKLKHPYERVVDMLPVMFYDRINHTAQNPGIILYFIPVPVPVTQLFVKVRGNEKAGTRYGLDGLETWLEQYSTANVLAVATVPSFKDDTFSYLVCFEMARDALPDSLADYYQSVPVEPSEFTPLTDAKAPLTESGTPPLRH